jgi:hypothetical protein
MAGFWGNPGTIILDFLMKVVLAIAIGVIGVAATCLTCCLGPGAISRSDRLGIDPPAAP